MRIHFTKMQGAGNDYVYISLFTENIPEKQRPELARRLSDRHFGIGGDGVIFIAPGHTPLGHDAENGQKAGESCQFEMLMYNQDGSRGEMCGNGIRCVGKYVYDHDMIPGVNRKKHPDEAVTVTIESTGAVKYLTLYPRDGLVRSARVDMGEPILDPDRIPLDTGVLEECRGRQGGGSEDRKKPVVDLPLSADGRSCHITAVSMGNPHCVLFVEKLGQLDITKIGPAFEHHPLFPKRTNTEFVHVVDRQHVEMRVWERGSGETLACGTGCCAVCAACVLNEKTDRSIEVKVLGGRILVDWDERTNHIFMTGPAETVFDGIFDTDSR